MRRYFFLTVAISLFPLLAHAAAVPGDLIKGSSSSVYYLNADNKRYVFPTERTYTSWYADFSSVKTLSDAEIASFMIGGNVTYRPGVRLVKITTDPKVYAVSRGGTLRWIQTEDLARALYSTDWAKMLDDIPDAFFINYRVGSPIAAASDYTPASERDAIVTIQADKQTMVTPTPPPPTTASPTTPVAPTSTTPTPPTSGVATLISNQNPRAGETINLLARAQPSSGVSLVKLFFDGSLLRSCEYSPCSTDTTIPTSNVKPTYVFRTETSWITGQSVVTTSTIPIASGNVAITLTIPRPEIRPGSRREAIVSIASNLFIAHTVDIFLDGVDVKGCNDVQDCRYIADETSATGTVHTFSVIAGDRNGFTITSETRTLRVVDNDHPVVTVLPGRSSLLKGDSVDVTISASDEDGVAATEIWVDGTLLKHCASGTCTTNTGPWNEARSLVFVGRAQDTLGLWGSTSSTAIAVQ